MPIKYIHREHLDEEKYNQCIDTSIQSKIYAFSWYLDTVCDQWAVLVLNDYEAVMPVPWRKKYGFKYVHQPLWVLQLGIFSRIESINEQEFIKKLSSCFKFIELRFNIENSIQKINSLSSINEFQYLHLEDSYEILLNKFNRNRKRELKKAIQANLRTLWGDQPEKLIALFEKNIGGRINKISKEDYRKLKALIKLIISKGLGEVLTIYDHEERPVASGFFLFHKHKVTELVCATDLKNRHNGANTFLIDRALFKYQNSFEIFDFGGSSMKSIAKYYKSFGAGTYQYLFLKVNRLPFILRLFKS